MGNRSSRGYLSNPLFRLQSSQFSNSPVCQLVLSVHALAQSSLQLRPSVSARPFPICNLLIRKRLVGTDPESFRSTSSRKKLLSKTSIKPESIVANLRCHSHTRSEPLSKMAVTVMQTLRLRRMATDLAIQMHIAGLQSHRKPTGSTFSSSNSVCRFRKFFNSSPQLISNRGALAKRSARAGVTEW